MRVDTHSGDTSGRGVGLGSGVMISPDGLILTNSHVIGRARAIGLADTEGRTTDAQLIGDDPDTDLALIRANAARDLPVAALGVAATTGAMLTTVDQAGPAAAGGLLHGDTIVALDGEPVASVDDLIRLMPAERIGRSATVDVLRLGRQRRFSITPSERPHERRRPAPPKRAK